MPAPAVTHRHQAGDEAGDPGAPGSRWWPRLGYLAWAGPLLALWPLVTLADRGLDMMDESHYVLAAQPWAHASAFNGMFGWYLGPVLTLLGHNLAAFRLLGVALVVVVGAFLARSVRLAAQRVAGRPWPAWLRHAWPPGCVGAALCYYTLFVRTPSYNWLTDVGLALAAAGLCRLVAADGAGRRSAVAAGSALAGGLFLTATGKVTSALAAAAVAAVVVAGLLLRPGGRRPVLRATGVAVAVAALAALGHVVLVNDVATTLATFRRVAAGLSLVDPDHYGTSARWGTVLRGLHDATVGAVGRPLLLALLPLLALFRPCLRVITGRDGPGRGGRDEPIGARTLLLLALPGVTLPAIWVAATFPGGVPGLEPAAMAPTVAAETAVATALSAAGARWVTGRPAQAARPGVGLLLGLALAALALCAPLGTNVGYASQLPGAVVLLLAAVGLLTATLPGAAARLLPGVAAVAMALLVPVLVITTEVRAPWRIAPLGQQTHPRTVVPGGPALRVDGATAAWVDGLRAGARASGWRAGDRLLDLTWHPGALLALDARAPAMLIPAFPGWPTPERSAAFALAREPREAWRKGWLLRLADDPDQRTNAVTGVLGLRFPEDYVLVTEVIAPYDWQRCELWRPRG